MALTEADFNLLRAASSGKRNAVLEALNHPRVDKNCREQTGYCCTAVQRAALSNESVVDIFINDAAVGLSLTDDLGRTLLHLSWSTCVRRLRDSGRMVNTDWNLRDQIRQTPLLCHARFVNLRIVPELLNVRLSSGEPAVDMTKKTMDKFTVLHQAVEHDPRSFPAWYLLRSPDERSKLVGLLLRELMKRARQRRQVANLSQQDRELQSDVLPFVNEKDKLNRSALHYIAEEGCVVILDKLLECFTDQEIRSEIRVNDRDFHGFTPLHLAVRGGHTGMVKQLLDEQQIKPNVPAIVNARHPRKLQNYEKNHRELCRPDLFSKVPTEQYSGNRLTPLHLAAMRGHTEITRLLLRPPKTRVLMKDTEGLSPLDYSIVYRHFQVAAVLLLDNRRRIIRSIRPHDRWKKINEVLCLADGPDDKTTANELLNLLVDSKRRRPAPNTSLHDIEELITEAARMNRHTIIRHVLKWQPEVNANHKSCDDDRGLTATPLHFGVLGGSVDAVRVLLTHLPLDPNAEDSSSRTPLQIAITEISDQNIRNEIERLLMGRPEVKAFVDRLYRDRQVLVDAANALLVGAALIASVTFAGWLQPPLGYTTYYDFPAPPPAPPSTYESFAAVKQHATVQAFWFFNSLSFFFAIATVLTGASAAMPSLENAFIGTVVKSVKRTLIYASLLFAISVVCVLCAFATAGFAVLPPRAKYKWSMISTVAIGVFVCLIFLGFFLWKISEPIHSRIIELASKLSAPICWPLVTYLTGYR